MAAMKLISLPRPRRQRNDGLAVLLSLFLSLGVLPALWAVLAHIG